MILINNEFNELFCNPHLENKDLLPRIKVFLDVMKDYKYGTAAHPINQRELIELSEYFNIHPIEFNAMHEVTNVMLIPAYDGSLWRGCIIFGDKPDPRMLYEMTSVEDNAVIHSPNCTVIAINLNRHSDVIRTFATDKFINRMVLSSQADLVTMVDLSGVPFYLPETAKKAYHDFLGLQNRVCHYDLFDRDEFLKSENVNILKEIRQDIKQLKVMLKHINIILHQNGIKVGDSKAVKCTHKVTKDTFQLLWETTAFGHKRADPFSKEQISGLISVYMLMVSSITKLLDIVEVIPWFTPQAPTKANNEPVTKTDTVFSSSKSSIKYC